MTDIRVYAARQAVKDLADFLKPVQVMFDELRTMQPEIERQLAVCEGELPEPGSLQRRRIERDVFALARRLRKLEERIRHVRPGAMELIERISEISPEASKGGGDGD